MIRLFQMFSKVPDTVSPHTIDDPQSVVASFVCWLFHSAVVGGNKNHHGCFYFDEDGILAVVTVVEISAGLFLIYQLAQVHDAFRLNHELIGIVSMTSLLVCKSKIIACD